MLDDFRHDPRLLAAKEGGDLVQCDWVEGLGPFGITKRKREDEPGMDYFRQCLVATAAARSAVLYASFKGGITGIRDNLIALQLGVPTMTDWEADPYG